MRHLILLCGALLGPLGACSDDASNTPQTPDGQDGSSSTKDAGGNVPDAPHTVLACDKLAAPGQWEKVTPLGDLGDAIAISIDPFKSGGLFVDMHKGGNGHHEPTDGLYKSEDCGSTWSAQINKGTNGDAVAQGSWSSMVVDPVQRGVIYAAPIYGAGGIFKTTDGGVNWTQFFAPETPLGKIVNHAHFDSISMDPNDHLHLVAGTHDTCNAPYAPECEAETTDGGMTWNFVKIPAAGFEENAGPYVLNATSWIYAGANGVFLTTDNGKTFGPNVADITWFTGGQEEIHSILRLADGTYLVPSAYGIVKSTDGKTWSKIQGSSGISYGLTAGKGSVYSSFLNVATAKTTDLSKWSEIPRPSGLDPKQVCLYVDYDEGHSLLYMSCFGGGVWRMVTQ